MAQFAFGETPQFAFGETPQFAFGETALAPVRSAALWWGRCQEVGWPPLRFGVGEESPGSTETRCRVTPGGGDPRESATESRPPVLVAGKGERVR